MTFNTYLFLFGFLPLSYALAAAVNRWGGRTLSLVGMAAISAAFYAFSSVNHLLLLLLSIAANYTVAARVRGDRRWLWLGVAGNLALLCVVKYTALATATLRDMGLADSVHAFALPLAISFYTFHQISFLVDLHRGRAGYPPFPVYLVYVLFYPQLVAGPIVRYHEIRQRLERPRPFPLTASGFRLGLFLIAAGLAKKVVLADSMGASVNLAFEAVAALSLIEAWTTMVAFAFQIYFDFSGYTDIALGVGLLFGIRLPVNFNSPYKAASITEFWRRWHMSLSRFLRDYLYVPLGGNRKGAWRQKVNLLTVMALGGLWHGASWSFLVWGVLHGLYLVVHRLWERHVPFRLPRPLAVAVTFVAVVLAWLPFRAPDFPTLALFFGRMTDPRALVLPERLAGLGQRLPWLADVKFASLPFANVTDLVVLAAVAVVVFAMPNTRQMAIALRGGVAAGMLAGLMLAAALVLMLETPLAFVYFRF